MCTGRVAAHDAVRHVHRLLNTGYRDVVDADLSGYFDSIPHAELLASVARRVSDRHMLHLIKQWLVVPVEEEDDRGRKHRTAEARHTRKGIPQGAPISPLLSNLYMRRFILGWKTLGHAARLDAHIVNFADDLVILCYGTAEKALQTMREMMERLKHTSARSRTHRLISSDIPLGVATHRRRVAVILVRGRRGRASLRYAVPSVSRPAGVGW